MNASLRYVVFNLLRRRARTTIGVLGILLTIALLTAIQVGLDSLSISYLDLVALQAGKADLVVTRSGNDPFNPQAFDPAEILPSIEKDARVRGTTPRWFGIVQAQSRGEEHYAILIGLDPARERAHETSGLVPEPTLPPGYCAVYKSLVDRLKTKRGARVSIRSPTTASELTLGVETVLERQMLLPQQVRDYIVVGPAAAALIPRASRIM